MSELYWYRALIIRWVDGDTVDLHVDLGFTVRVDTRFRLLGVDTPERGQAGWAEAKAFVEGYAPADTAVTIRSEKPLKADKYGRWLAEVWPDGAVSVNQALTDAGLALPYDGGAR